MLENAKILTHTDAPFDDASPLLIFLLCVPLCTLWLKFLETAFIRANPR